MLCLCTTGCAASGDRMDVAAALSLPVGAPASRDAVLPSAERLAEEHPDTAFAAVGSAPVVQVNRLPQPFGVAERTAPSSRWRRSRPMDQRVCTSPGSRPPPGKQAGEAAPSSPIDTAGQPAMEFDQQGRVCEMSLSQALTMVGGRNPQVAFADARYREAYARWEAAQVLWLPSIRGGMSYNKHDGELQGVEGEVFDVSRNALEAGLGAAQWARAARRCRESSPTSTWAMRCISRRSRSRRAAAQRDGIAVTTQQVMLDTALTYLGVLEAAQLQAVAAEAREDAQQLAALPLSHSPRRARASGPTPSGRGCICSCANRPFRRRRNRHGWPGRGSTNSCTWRRPYKSCRRSRPWCRSSWCRASALGRTAGGRTGQSAGAVQARNLVAAAVQGYRRERDCAAHAERAGGHELQWVWRGRERHAGELRRPL